MVKGLMIMFISLPLAVAGFIGINGEPITTYLFYLFRFLKVKRKLVYVRGYGDGIDNTGQGADTTGKQDRPPQYRKQNAAKPAGYRQAGRNPRATRK